MGGGEGRRGGGGGGGGVITGLHNICLLWGGGGRERWGGGGGRRWWGALTYPKIRHSSFDAHYTLSLPLCATGAEPGQAAAQQPGQAERRVSAGPHRAAGPAEGPPPVPPPAPPHLHRLRPRRRLGVAGVRCRPITRRRPSFEENVFVINTHVVLVLVQFDLHVVRGVFLPKADPQRRGDGGGGEGQGRWERRKGGAQPGGVGLEAEKVAQLKGSEQTQQQHGRVAHWSPWSERILLFCYRLLCLIL